MNWTLALLACVATLVLGAALQWWRRTALLPPMATRAAAARAVARAAAAAAQLGEHVGVVAVQGRRPYMEDAWVALDDLCGDGRYSLYGVLDGHGGSGCALFCQAQLPHALRAALHRSDDGSEPHVRTALLKAFDDTDRRYLQLCERSGGSDGDGSTAVMALLRRGGAAGDADVLFVANVGDSRAVLCHKGDAVPMSRDHKPTRPDEKERIEDAGGRIVFFGTWRVEGVLALTRAMGDLPLKPLVSSLPEIMQRPLVHGDEFVIVASDGLWDVIDSQRAVNIVRKMKGDAVAAARALVAFAYKLGSADNITCIVIDLHKHSMLSATSST